MNGKAGKQNNFYLSCMNGPSVSFRQASWRRLKKNRAAMAGALMIVLSVLVAVFGYLIAPDPSPYANRIILEIGGQHPGFTQDFLLVKKAAPLHSGFFDRLLYGRPDQYDQLPISAAEKKADSMVVQKYIDEGVSERLSFPLSQLAEKPV